MKPGNLIVALAALRGVLGHRDHDDDERERIVEPGDRQPGAELWVVVLLVASSLAAIGFVLSYALGASTQILGLTLAGSFALLAAALTVVSKCLVVTEELPKSYPEPDPEAQQQVADVIEQSGSRLTRKRLLCAAAGAAGGSLGAALVAPAVSLGPLFDTSSLYATPWRPGRRLVDTDGVALLAADVSDQAFHTAYPEGASHDGLGAALVVVRLDPAELDLPAGREGWAPGGILAFSKICTHAGCAVSLYRRPLFAPTAPKKALVCPCHYSTFDPATGAQVIFGPAGRPLPQLPLMIGTDGTLRAAGNYSGPVGPAWSGVRSRPPDAS